MVSYLKEKHQEPKIKKPRPSRQKKTPELIEKIFNHMLENGRSMIWSCKTEGISPGSFIGWVQEDKKLAEQYTYALRARTEYLSEQMLDIATDATEDDIFDANGNRLCNREWINRSRLRIDTLKWHLSKTLPKKYGDHLQVDSNSNASVTHSGGTVNVNISTDPVQASRDYQDFIRGKK